MHELQIANMLSKDITYRKLAAIFFRSNKKEIDSRLENEKIVDEAKVVFKKSVFFKRPYSPAVGEKSLNEKVQTNISDKESSTSNKMTSPLIGLGKLILEIKPENSNRLLLSKQNLFITTTEDQDT